jgi:hypothetical protein
MKNTISKQALIAAVSLLLPVSVMAAPPGTSKDEKGSYISGRLLIKGKPGIDEGKFLNILAKHSAAMERKLDRIGVTVAKVPPGLEKKILAEIQANPSIDFVELDRLVPASFVPNDPGFGSQWHLAKVGAASAWDGASAETITIAILDTGVDATHPDLAAHLLPGWNTASGNSDTSDIYGHGTKVAGAAAAAFNNGLGVAGLARDAKILPVRISNDSVSGVAPWSAISSGVTWAADHNARVAVNSYVSWDSATVTSAAAYLRSKGGQMVAAGGNYGTLRPDPDNPEIIVASATDGNDIRAGWSNSGPAIDVAAPGVSIYTTTRGGGYGYVNGTSFSTPLTGALVALVMGVNPDLSPQDVEKIIEDSAYDPTGTGFSNDYGHGRIDAAAAIAMAKTYTPTVMDTIRPSVSIKSPASGSTVNGVVGVDVSASDNVGVAKVDLYVNGALLGTDAVAPYSFSWDTTPLGNSTATLTAYAYDTSSNKTVSSAATINVYNIVDTTPPVASILSPASGAKVSGSVTINAAATDNVKVSSLSLSIDGKVVKTATGASLSYSWNTKQKNIKAGSHTIAVTATDSSQNKATAQIFVTK